MRELARDFLNVAVFSFVTIQKDRTTRDHFQIRQLREIVNDALCQAIAYVFAVGISHQLRVIGIIAER